MKTAEAVTSGREDGVGGWTPAHVACEEGPAQEGHHKRAPQRRRTQTRAEAVAGPTRQGPRGMGGPTLETRERLKHNTQALILLWQSGFSGADTFVGTSG